MKKLTFSLLCLFLLTLFAIFVNAVTWELDILAPTNSSSLTNRDVNYSFNFSVTGLPLLNNVSLNVTIYRNDTLIAGPFNVSNSTFFNFTNATVNGVYEWYYNVTNGTQHNVSDTFEYTISEPITDTYVFEILHPNQDGEFNIFLDQSVNFSFVVNATGGFLGTNEQLSCDVMNRSSVDGDYSILFSNNVSNGTFFNRTFTVADDRHQFYVNCSNSFQEERKYGNSLETFFDVNTDFFNVPIGENLNISFLTGSIISAGDISADAFILDNSSDSPVTAPCTGVNAGMIKFNQSNGIFFGCNGTDWARLND